ncbi:MAG TPA: DUF2589 domain-containing protein [Candidatus Angelobacter sp.]|nr:DUF2589 domain-containing protein [Candidatus Angelobacter sp.]
MPIDIGKEMALPMEQIIGGPLQAVIKAQSMAASASAQFITQVGLQQDPTTKVMVARTVDFSFKRLKPPADDKSQATQETVDLTVPLLTIVPIPFIRVEEATIDFECKVSSSTLDTSQQNFSLDASASGGFFGVNFSVKASYSQQSTHKDQVDKSATLHVTVKAVQDDMPGGLKKMLEILETAVVDGLKPPAPAPKS